MSQLRTKRTADALRRLLAVSVLLVGVLAGCTSLPETSGYTAATIQVKQAVKACGNVVYEELRAAEKNKAVPVDPKALDNLKTA